MTQRRNGRETSPGHRGEVDEDLGPVGAGDLEEVLALHRRCSDRSLWQRYRSAGVPSARVLERLVALPGGSGVRRAGALRGWVCAAPDPASGPGALEVGVLVEDAWQGQGLGRLLMRRTAVTAALAGWTHLVVNPAPGVAAVGRLAAGVGLVETQDGPDGPLRVRLADPCATGWCDGAARTAAGDAVA